MAHQKTGWPILCSLTAKGGLSSGARPPFHQTATMPKGLIRHHQTGDLHFLTISCHRHTNILGTPTARDTLRQILEETRQKYAFQIIGYVFMSNHLHLLITEPEQAKLSTAIQVLKQRFSRTRREEFVWEPRYHDFNVFTDAKRIEKLRYMHRNPIKAGLVTTTRRVAMEQLQRLRPRRTPPSPNHNQLPLTRDSTHGEEGRHPYIGWPRNRMANISGANTSGGPSFSALSKRVGYSGRQARTRRPTRAKTSKQ
jgi:putative transposase